MRKIILSLATIVLGSCSCAFSMTVQNIIDQVRLLERDTNSSTYRYTDAQIIARMNIIQDEIATKTQCIQNRTYITTISSTTEYRLPSDCINVIRVAYYNLNSTSTYKKLTFTTIAGQDYGNPYWQNQAPGQPLEYYRRCDYIGLKPAPSSVYAGTNNIQLDYNVKASTLVNTTDIPFNGIYNLYTFHQAIVWGVCAMCEYDKGNYSNTAVGIYQDWIQKIKDIYYTEPDKNTNFVTH